MEKALTCIQEILIEMKDENIKFNYMSFLEAEKFLRNNTYGYNLFLYKSNFMKDDLDFAYLKDLSIIDTRLRMVLYPMLLDIEFYLKVNLISEIQWKNKDDAVNLFLQKDFNNYKCHKRVHKNLWNRKSNPYLDIILRKYNIKYNKLITDISLYDFLSVITFGEFVHFYEFCINTYGLYKLNKYMYILRELVVLRNAVAHNNYLLYGLGEIYDNKKFDVKIVKYLLSCNINKNIIYKMLKNPKVRQITYVFYIFDKVVTSDGRKKRLIDNVYHFFYNRVPENKKYYQNNGMLLTIYFYFDSILKNKYKSNLYS